PLFGISPWFLLYRPPHPSAYAATSFEVAFFVFLASGAEASPWLSLTGASTKRKLRFLYQKGLDKRRKIC
ncbi:MAG: hypothetical protein J6A26_00315, partial [Oscillospiraceae bacterium]|nr:hypothetical protein [Oscillospiraceae bacterium]